jgi:hypothetical protein
MLEGTPCPLFKIETNGGMPGICLSVSFSSHTALSYKSHYSDLPTS